MSEIIYDAAEIEIEEIGLNGRPGAIAVYRDQEAIEDFDNFVTFKDVWVAWDFIDRLNAELLRSGYERVPEPAVVGSTPEGQKDA